MQAFFVAEHLDGTKASLFPPLILIFEEDALVLRLSLIGKFYIPENDM
jgi:hypothetical protein